MPDNIKVKIFNNEFILKSGDAGEKQTIEIAKYVDDKMKEIANMTSIVSTSKIAILTALNIADELFGVKKTQNTIPVKEMESVEETIKLLDTVL